MGKNCPARTLSSLQNLYISTTNFTSKLYSLKTRNYSKKKQYLISTVLIILTATLCFFSVGFIGYRAIALILLVVVSVNAILFDIFPVLISALLSALIWNFFFIPPTLTLHIGTPEDGLMFLMYFVIASINAVLTFKIREGERKERDEEEKNKSIQLYNTLLNSLSHELKTPISTIIGAIDTIKDDEGRLTENNRFQLYSEIEIASFRLKRQVENLLSMSRLEAGFIQPKKDWCDLNEIVFTTIKNNNADNHKILFTPNESLPFFRLDSGLIEQILHNLIHNALQHTPENSIIKIKVSRNEAKCILEISDDGNGFPPNHMPFVFDKFYRLNNTATGGAGLGLSIVKGYTIAMGGQVYLENSSQGGAKFTVEIPCEFSTNNHLKHE